MERIRDTRRKFQFKYTADRVVLHAKVKAFTSANSPQSADPPSLLVTLPESLNTCNHGYPFYRRVAIQLLVEQSNAATWFCRESLTDGRKVFIKNHGHLNANLCFCFICSFKSARLAFKRSSPSFQGLISILININNQPAQLVSRTSPQMVSTSWSHEYSCCRSTQFQTSHSVRSS